MTVKFKLHQHIWSAVFSWQWIVSIVQIYNQCFAKLKGNFLVRQKSLVCRRLKTNQSVELLAVRTYASIHTGESFVVRKWFPFFPLVRIRCKKPFEIRQISVRASWSNYSLINKSVQRKLDYCKRCRRIWKKAPIVFAIHSRNKLVHRASSDEWTW